MIKALVVIHSGFELIETICIVDVLRALGVKTDICSVEKEYIKSFRDIVIKSDILFPEVDHEEYDCLIFPGGPSADELLKNKHVLNLTEKFNSENKLIGAICGGPQILSCAKILTHKQATSHPKLRDKINCKEYLESDVVIDGNIITSRSPATALEFAFTIGKLLSTPEKYNEISNGFLYKK